MKVRTGVMAVGSDRSVREGGAAVILRVTLTVRTYLCNPCAAKIMELNLRDIDVPVV